MTLDEFMDELEAGSKRRWAIGPLRGRLRDDRGLCPICSLAKDRGWETDWAGGANDIWDEAAEHLGLDYDDAQTVVDVADADFYMEAPEYPELRDRLCRLLEKRT